MKARRDGSKILVEVTEVEYYMAPYAASLEAHLAAGKRLPQGPSRILVDFCKALDRLQEEEEGTYEQV